MQNKSENTKKIALTAEVKDHIEKSAHHYMYGEMTICTITRDNRPRNHIKHRSQ